MVGLSRIGINAVIKHTNQVIRTDGVNDIFSRENMNKIKRCSQDQVSNQHWQGLLHGGTAFAGAAVTIFCVSRGMDASSPVSIVTKFGDAGGSSMRAGETGITAESQRTQNQLTKSSEGNKRQHETNDALLNTVRKMNELQHGMRLPVR